VSKRSRHHLGSLRSNLNSVTKGDPGGAERPLFIIKEQRLHYPTEIKTKHKVWKKGGTVRTRGPKVRGLRTEVQNSFVVTHGNTDGKNSCLVFSRKKKARFS